MNFQLNVRFETINDALVKAYVNDVYIGRVKFGLGKKNVRGQYEPRVIFRCTRNPFNCIVPNSHNAAHESNLWTVAEAIEKDTMFRDALIPIVIRNALRNYGHVLYAETGKPAFAIAA